MLVKYMRLVDKEKFPEALTIDVTDILKRIAKLDNRLATLRDSLHKHGDSDQIVLGSLKKVTESFNELENMTRLLETNITGFYNSETTKPKTVLEETLETLKGLSENKGGLINDNND